MRKMDINYCTARLLSQKCGLTLEIADRIIEFRRKKGRIQSLDELLAVDGITRSILDKISKTYQVKGKLIPPAVGTRLPYEHFSTPTIPKKSVQAANKTESDQMKYGLRDKDEFTPTKRGKKQKINTMNVSGNETNTFQIIGEANRWPDEIARLRIKRSEPKYLETELAPSLLIHSSKSGENLVLKYLEQSTKIQNPQNPGPRISIGVQTSDSMTQIETKKTKEHIVKSVQADDQIVMKEQLIKMSESHFQGDNVQNGNRKVVKRKRKLRSDVSKLSDSKRKQICQWLESVEYENDTSEEFEDAFDNGEDEKEKIRFDVNILGCGPESNFQNETHDFNKGTSKYCEKIVKEKKKKKGIQNKDGSINRHETKTFKSSNTILDPLPGTSSQYSNLQGQFQNTQTKLSGDIDGHRVIKLKSYSMVHKMEKEGLSVMDKSVTNGSRTQEKRKEYIEIKTKNSDKLKKKKMKRRKRSAQENSQDFNGCTIL